MSTLVVLDILQSDLIQKKEGFLNDAYISNEFSITRSINSTFYKDKLFKHDKEILISIDGFVLNRENLIQNSKSKDFFIVLKELYIEKGDGFIKDLKGDFSLVLYDFKESKLFISTNITSSKPVFYYKNNNIVVFSTNPVLITNYLKTKGILYSLDIQGAYYSMVYNYMIGETTLIKEIKKLLPGNYLVCSQKKIRIERYFNINNLPDISSSKKEILRNIDDLFNEAVNLEYKKDLEYNYDHIATLSGGLDSRMNVMYAHKLGYKNITAVNFGVKNYWDYYIAKRISKNLNLNFKFYDLKDGSYLKNIDEINFFLGAVGKYYGPAQSYHSFKKINWTNNGLIHSGQLGDVVMGSSFSLKSKTENYSLSELKRDSNLLIEKISVFDLRGYSNIEIANIYNRGFNGTLRGNIISQEFSEMSSPFLYQDFLEYALKIPFEYKKKNKLYYEWIDKYLPKAGDFFYDGTQRITVLKKRSLLSRVRIKLLYYKYNYLRKTFAESINPYNQWFESDKLKTFFDNYFNTHIDLINDSELKNDCIFLYKNGKATDKLSVISLLNSINLFFN